MKGYQCIYKGILVVLGCYLLGLLGCSPKNAVSQLAESPHDEASRAQIINGEPVTSFDPIAQSTVSLYFMDTSNSLKQLCSATLIAHNTVLTAAHCIKDFAEIILKMPVEELTERIRVGFGLQIINNESNPEVKLIKVKKLLVHPEYESNMLGRARSGYPVPDLALLLLETNAPENYLPVTLGNDPNIIQTGTPLTLAGYGVTSSRGEPAQQLMKVNVNISEPKINPVQFSYKIVNGKSACKGDSGGPAYQINPQGQLILIGVTSWGDRFCSKFGVYTSVPAFAEFIENAVRALNP